MANTSTKARNTAAAFNKPEPKEPKKAEAEVAITSDPAIKQEEPKSYRVKKDLDPNMFVTVKNGFNGTLVYKSKKTGERFIWDAFGDEQEMELSELKAAKNSYKAFFVNNWFLFDDPEIVDWLGMTQYYKHALNSASFDKLFEKTPAEIEKTIKELSEGQKKSVVFRAKQLIADGTIDSIKVITALEKSLSVELIEH